MFITSTFSVIRSRSLWSHFHVPVILPYILKTISRIDVFLKKHMLRILVQCDTAIDILTNVGHLDLYFIVQWFFPISWMLVDVWASLFGITNQYDPAVDINISVGFCDLYFMVQWFYVTSWRQFNVLLLYFEIMLPIFHSPVIFVLYIPLFDT